MSVNNRQAGPGGPGPGGFGGGGAMGLVMPVEKPKNARGTFVRLLAYFKPSWPLLTVVVAAAILSTVFSVLSPKLLGNITTDLFVGVVQKLHGVPGGGVNFPEIVRLLADLALLYVFSAAFNWVQQYLMAGVAQRTVFTIRQ